MFVLICFPRVVLWVSLRCQMENLTCLSLVVANRHTPLFSAEKCQTKDSRTVTQWFQTTLKSYSAQCVCLKLISDILQLYYVKICWYRDYIRFSQKTKFIYFYQALLFLPKEDISSISLSSLMQIYSTEAF